MSLSKSNLKLGNVMHQSRLLPMMYLFTLDAHSRFSGSIQGTGFFVFFIPSREKIVFFLHYETIFP